jgi:hypothetical protein
LVLNNLVSFFDLRPKYFTCQILVNLLIIKMSKVTLGYWRVRGRAQVPRLLLAYTGTQFEDVQYKESQQWFGGDK